MSGLPMPILESYRVHIPAPQGPMVHHVSPQMLWGGAGQARMKFLSSGPSDGTKRRLSVTFE